VTITSPGNFSSPGYPLQYTDNLNYTWYIYSQRNSKIHIVFTEFVTERRHDYVTLSDYVNYQWVEKERYSGTHTKLIIISASNRLRVRFITDRSVTTKGFSGYFYFGKYIPNRNLIYTFKTMFHNFEPRN